MFVFYVAKKNTIFRMKYYNSYNTFSFQQKRKGMEEKKLPQVSR